MNRNATHLFIFTLTVYLTGCPVQAQGNSNTLPPPPPGNNPPSSGWQPGSGHGHGGNLTPEQRAERKQRMLQRFDTNGNGVLDPDEKAKMHQFMQERRARRFGQQGQGQGPGPNPGTGPAGNYSPNQNGEPHQ
jgi:Spy/CpxP family protein refolding chaperone